MISFRSFVLTAATTLAISPGAHALQPPLEALPPETLGVMRLDMSTETLDRLADTTRMGAAFLSEEKRAEYRAVFERFLEEDSLGQDFARSLGELGLEPEDLYPILTSQLGGAVVKTDFPEKASLLTVLVWAEMSGDAAHTTLEVVLEDVATEDHIQRIDEEIAGARVSRVRDTRDGTSYLLAVMENRVMFAMGFPSDMFADPSLEELEAQMDDDTEPSEGPVLVLDADYEAAEMRVLGQFIQGQHSGGGGFLEGFYADPGVTAARPATPSRMELLLDLKGLMELIPPEQAQIAQALGLEQFSRLAMWNGLNAAGDATNIFLSAPAPRRGLARLFEVERFSFDPPEWIPANVRTYSAASVDFSLLLDVGVEIARKLVPPEMIEQRLGMTNQQLGAMFGIDLQGLMAAFGKRVHLLEFPMRMETMGTGDNTMEVPVSPQALVMDFERADILQAALTMMGAPMASNPNSGMTLVDELGFQGIRMQSPQGAVVIAHGLGKLVVATGEGNASRIFSHLNNPPEGEDALRFAPGFRAYLEENQPKPGILFSYADGAKSISEVSTAMEFLRGLLPPDQGEDDFDVIDELFGLIPSEEELEGLIGAIHSRAELNDQGLLLEGLTELK